MPRIGTARDVRFEFLGYVKTIQEQIPVMVYLILFFATNFAGSHVIDGGTAALAHLFLHLRYNGGLSKLSP